jgi:ATP-dependent Lon protease
MTLQTKIIAHFDGKVVRKDLSKLVKGNAVVPSYVLEYLLGQHCASSDEEIIAVGLENVKQIIKKHYVHRDEAEIIKSLIKENGQHKVIDKISVRLNERKDVYEANFSNLGIKRVVIDSESIKQHPKLLTAGVWCIVTIAHFFTEEKDASPWIVEQLKPIQISNIDLEEFKSLRTEFTTEEWADLLLQSIGFNPEYFTFRDKLIQLTRLIPFAENNYNLIELGPKGTGKSHLFSELSPHGILISGGDITQAKLFVNNASGDIGLVGFWDTIAFDEFAGKDKRVDRKLVDIMKNYMANKSFSRGRDVYGASASFVFVGNTDHSVAYMLKHSDLFEALPKAYYDTAFLDRVHAYIPGWEVQKLRNEMFTDSYGFIVDYIAEVLRELRKEDYSSLYRNYFSLSDELTTRDRTAVNKTFAGLAKILFPNGECTKEEVAQLLDFALECRKRVKDQLVKMDHTFETVSFARMDLQTNKERQIETLEVQTYAKKVTEDDEPDITTPKTEVIESDALQPKTIEIKDNEIGISYYGLFAEYLKGATEIEVIDPYIRQPYQIHNFVEFCTALHKIKPKGDILTITLTTWNDSEYTRNQSDVTFIELAEHLSNYEVDFDYKFDETIHDRYIIANNGWKIILGRGFDIFQRVEERYSMERINPLLRRCRGCSITFNEENK